MNYGLYLSAAGALASLHRQDVIANNLANVNTVGFKPDVVATRQRLPERIESGVNADPQLLLETLGGGLLTQPTLTLHQQGPITSTSNDLDAAIDGPGFFVVQAGPGAEGGSVRLTRDGRFARDRGGELVMAATGMRVLDDQQRPIIVPSGGKLRIQTDGLLVQDDQSIGRLHVAQAPDPARLTKAGDGTFRADEATLRQLRPAAGRVVQGAVEGSGVDPILALKELMAASQALQANLKLMQYADNIMGQAINTLGRVA